MFPGERSLLIILISFALCIVSSCNRSNEIKETDTTLIQGIDSSVISSNSVPGKDSTENSLQDSSFHLMKNTLSLPPIKSVKYISTQNIFDHIYPKDSTYLDSLIKFLKNYNRSYQDMGKYKTYYVNVFCYKDSSAKMICPNDDLHFSLLILYDQASQEANVLTVSYGIPSESEYYEMSFDIKDDDKIILERSGQTEGEEGMPEDMETYKQIIKVDKNGSIKISDTL